VEEMKSFKNAKLMIEQIKVDLNNQTFPNLLTSLAVSTKTALESKLSNVATKHNGMTPSLSVIVETLPTPGTASVRATFSATVDGKGGTRTFDEAEAYVTAFRKECEEKLGSKQLMLRLLASVGIN